MIIVEIILPAVNSFDILFCLALIAKAVASPNSFIPLNRFTGLDLIGFKGWTVKQIGNNMPEMYFFQEDGCQLIGLTYIAI